MTAGTTYQLWAKRDADSGTDITAWAAKNMRATLSGAQTADLFSISVRRFSLIGHLPFPVELVPGMQVYYVRVPLVGDPELVWAARFRREGQPNDPSDFEGVFTLECTTPLNELKTVLERVVFNPTDHPTDVDRVAALLDVANIPLWMLQPGTTPSITYQLPPVGEETTVYEAKSVEEILNELRTDPGYPGDTGYPVPARTWQIYWQFATAATPEDGVLWRLQYYSASDLGGPSADTCYYHITDNPRDTDPHDAVILSGSTYNKDPSQIVRSIHVAGPKTDPIQPTWKNGVNVKRGHGQIRKNAGANGTWDAGAVSRNCRIIGGDYEAICQTQELFLQHETFQVPDSPILLRSNMKTAWEHLTTLNTLSVRGGRGRSRLATGLAQAVLDAKAATCILRSQWAVNKSGMQLLARVADASNYYKLQNTGAEYTFYRVVGGTPTSLGTLTATPADNDDLKINMIGNQFECYVNDVIKLTVTSSNFNTATKHGLGIDCDVTDAYLGEFYDLEVTDFWGDRAFGIGNEDNVTDWVDLSYGFVFNLNGTVTLVANGVPVGVPSDFTYNDWFKISTYLKLNMSTRAMERIVAWHKMAAAEAEWTQLHFEVTDQFVDKNNPWYVQFAAKELGSTLNNISLQKMYANQFHAPSPPYSEVDGQHPANGIFRSDELDTFQKRQQYADAFFSMNAEPTEVFTGTVRAKPDLEGVPWVVYPPYAVAITSVQRKWVDDGVTDNRKVLWMKSAQWLDQGTNPDYPNYLLTATSRDLEIDLQGPRHLRNPRSKTKKPDNRAFNQQEDAGDNITFSFEDPTGDENFGRYLRVWVGPQGTDDWEDSGWPIATYDVNSSTISVPKASLEPGVQHEMRYWTEDAAGNPSDMSGAIPFTAPKQPAYTRPYGYWISGGDGVDPIPAGILSQEIVFPEAGRIIQYKIMSPDPDSGVVVKCDVLKATREGRRDVGVGAYASIAGTDLPELPGPVAAANFNESTALTGWSQQVEAGDTLRVEVLDTPTPTAKNISVYIEFQREGTGT